MDLNSENIELIERYRALYDENPHMVDASWRAYFQNEPAASRDIGFEPKEVAAFIEAERQKGRSFSKDEKQHILHLLNKAESFETFLHTKYVGQKRFSLEGAETLIPMLSYLAEQDIDDLIIGMPHRGRLNVLANILHKSYREIFSEFEDVAQDSFEFSGDVKYHKGYSAKIGDKWLLLAANPSHLESVDAVVEGIARGRQKNGKRERVLPLLIHGDAAIAGQGVVYETLQMSGLEGYTTGGTIHIVINNHIGFTTLPADGRSTQYCTDIAKAFGMPVLRVNAEDPEACMSAIELAYKVRQKFSKDVFIDLDCYRKYGHNESDEPAFTQPKQYQIIRNKASIRTMYHEKLVKEGVEVALLDQEFKKELQDTHELVREYAKQAKNDIALRKIQERRHLFAKQTTEVAKSRLDEVIAVLCTIPDGFTLHPRLLALIEARRQSKLTAIDWAFSEALAFGTILQDGVGIRLAGQDSRRGTFSQRHGMWVDQKNEERHVPHAKIARDFELVDSFLSEYAALGFEYGYSLARPDALVLWEAQFGDFANGAQIIIDQYLAPGEQKWQSKSKLTLLLPHGYEGQGPEHSSARIERFLTLAAEDNMFVCYPSTPAQYFHLLRRQVHMQKPLILFTPKGLLRSSACVSPIEAFTSGTFQEVLDDVKDPHPVKRVVFCTGRLYYDLIEHAQADTAIVRIEQLYPVDESGLEAVIKRYTNAVQYIWAQEEPYNMGARSSMYEHIAKLLPKNSTLEYRGRTESSSPACGSHLVHEKEHKLILESIFRGKL